MPHYIGAIIDKSTLQALSAREAKWLFHHFWVNIPPILFSEVLADLSKTKSFATDSADGDVRMLVGKISSHSVNLSAAHYSLVAGELLGWQSIEMSGRPIISNAKIARMPDGSIGSYVDLTPFQRVMDCWRAGAFEDMEREFAKAWRSDQASIDLEGLKRETKNLWGSGRASLEEIVAGVQASLFGPTRNYSGLDALMQLAGAEPSHRAKALRRWNRVGRPAPIQFAPYTSFVARLEAIFLFGLHAGVITTRATNRLDIEYFKYLPFTEVFSSRDKIHETLFPVFARPNQFFVHGDELKSSLREMADYYDTLPDDQRKLGSMVYADYPPVAMDNVITKIFDQKFPRWRAGANLPRPPRDTSADAALIAELNARMEWVKRHGR